MIARRPEVIRHAATLGLAAGLLYGIGTNAPAQHTPDPYNIVGEYNNQYEPYMYASYPTSPGSVPNQNRLNTPPPASRTANSFQSFMESDDDSLGERGQPGATRRSGPGVPYYRAYQHLDDKPNRTYRPNSEIDDAFYSNQKQRDKKYFEALREQDPRKRAQMLRDYALDNMRSSREASAGRTNLDRDRESGRNREREPVRDRFSSGGSALDSDDPEADEVRRPSTAAPPARRGGESRLAPPPPPSGRGSIGNAPTGFGGARPTRSFGTTTPARPGTSAPNTSEVLKRSQLLDRARRGTAPNVPSSPPR